jgi:hypothetical protein
MGRLTPPAHPQRLSVLEKVHQQLCHGLWLFLLYPVPGTVNQVDAFHLGAC